MVNHLIKKTITPLDRTVGWWLAVALFVATLLPWQTIATTSNGGCTNICPTLVGPFSYQGPVFWFHRIYLGGVVLGLVIYALRLHFPNSGLLAKSWLLWIGFALAWLAFPAAGSSFAWTTGNAPSNFIQYQTTGAYGAWVSFVAAIAVFRGGYLIKGANDFTHWVKFMLFAPEG